MSITNITMQPTGLVDVNPSFIYIYTTDTLSTVLEPGYLNNAKNMGYTFSNSQLALVYVTTGVILLAVEVATDGIISLVPSLNDMQSELPVINDHLVAYSGTTGYLVKDSGIDFNTVVQNNILNDLTYTVTGQNPGQTFPIHAAITSTNDDVLDGDLYPLYGSVSLDGMSFGTVFGTRGVVTINGVTSTNDTNIAGCSSAIEFGPNAEIDQTILALFLGAFKDNPFAVSNAENVYHTYTKNESTLVPYAYDRRDGDATYLGVYDNRGLAPSFYLTAGTATGSAGKDSNCNAPFVFRVKINEIDGYIPIFTQNTD